MTVHEDPVDQNAYITELETENEALRQRLEGLERELQCRSPTESRQKPRIAESRPRRYTSSSW